MYLAPQNRTIGGVDHLPPAPQPAVRSKLLAVNHRRRPSGMGNSFVYTLESAVG